MNLKKAVARAAIACAIGLPALALGTGEAFAAPAGQSDCQKQKNCALPDIDFSKIRLSDEDLANIEQIQHDIENFQPPQLPNLSIPSIPTPPLLLLPPPEFQLPDLPPPPPPPGPKLIRMPWEPKLPWELF